METLTIEIRNKKAYQLIKDLEDLDIVKVLDNATEQPVPLSQRFSGKLKTETAQKLRDSLESTRNEWNQRTF